MEYDLSDIYHPRLVKQYGGMVNLVDDSETSYSFHGLYGNFFSIGKTDKLNTHGDTNQKLIVNTGKEYGQNSWFAYTHAC